MLQGADQREEILDHGTNRQRVDILCLVAHARLFQGIDNRDQVIPRTDQNGDRAARLLFSGLPDQLNNGLCFGSILSTDKTMERNRGLRLQPVKCAGHGETHGPSDFVFFSGEKPTQFLIDPFDHRFDRAEICIQNDPFHRQTVQASLADPQVKSDLCLAKPVNRLHRVTDDKQRAPVARLPSCGQTAQEIVLCIRGILEFIDQDMAKSTVELQQQFFRSHGRSEGLVRRISDFNKIDLPLLTKSLLQFSDRQRQQIDQRFQDQPLLL